LPRTESVGDTGSSKQEGLRLVCAKLVCHLKSHSSSEEYVDSLKIQPSLRSRYRHKYRAKSAVVLQDERVSYRIDFAAKKQF
jgi:hypothetical protein